MKNKFTILGCGSSLGSPWITNYRGKLKNNAKMIRPHDPKNKFILYILIFFTIITLVTLYLRMFHFDNKYVKTFVGITCIQDFFNFF